MSKKRLVNETAKHHRLHETKKLQGKLTQIKQALPNKTTLASWGAGPKAFAEKVRRILEEQ